MGLIPYSLCICFPFASCLFFVCVCAYVRECARVLYLLFCGVMVGAGGKSPIVFDLRPGFNNFLTEISFHVSLLPPLPHPRPVHAYTHTFVFSSFVRSPPHPFHP